MSIIFLLNNYVNNININCNYDNVYNNNLNNKSVRDLTFLHINIQGIASKYDKLLTFLQNLELKSGMPDFILLCEIFLTEINSSFFKIDGYKIVSKFKQNKKGGGVSILDRILILQYVMSYHIILMMSLKLFL